MMHHHEQQQQAFQSGSPHGMMGVHAGGGSFPQSPRPMPTFQGQRNMPQSGGPQGMVGGGQVHNQVAMQQQAYLKFAMMQQQQHKSHAMLLQQQQQAKMSGAGPSTRDQEMVNNNNPAKMQELMSLQAQMFKRQSEHLQQAEKQKEQAHPSSNEQRSGDMRPPMPTQGVPGQQMPPAGTIRPMQGQVGMANAGGNLLTPAQFQSIQAWAKEHNLDLSNPANMSAISQLLPVWQPRMATKQKQNEASMAAQQQQASPLQVNSDTPGHGNLPSQSASLKPRQPLPSNSSVSGGEEAKTANLGDLQLQQQLPAHNRDGSNDRAARPPMTVGNGGQPMQMPQSSGRVSKVPPEQSNSKNVLLNSEAMQMQYARQMQQLNQGAAPTTTPGGTAGSQALTQAGRTQTGFTKHQLKVLKAQILAFRRLKVLVVYFLCLYVLVQAY
jgi:hypothetical protein